MKLKSLLVAFCFCLIGQVFAENTHYHANADQKSMPKGMTYPNYCEIEIINPNYETVYVLGTFDDSSVLGFDLYPRDTQYISLYYPDIWGNWICHSGMNIQVMSPYRVLIDRWVYVHETVVVPPTLK